MEGGNFQSLQYPKNSPSWMLFGRNFVAFCCLFSKKVRHNLNFERKKNSAMNTMSRVKISHQFTSDEKKWLHISGLQILNNFDVSRTWKSNHVNLYQPIFWKKSANVNGKQICKNGTTSRWKPNLYQVTLFHRDGFFKATPNPPFFAAPKKPEMKVKKNVNDKNTQTITEKHDKSFVP